MRVLLDTHAFLYFIRADPALSSYARQVIQSSDNERLLSVASLWEMAIKCSLGKLTLAIPFTELVSDHVVGNDMALLHIAPEHLDLVTKLPFHHKDPFDRLLAAQSLVEDIPVLSNDKTLDRYGTKRLWKRAIDDGS